LPSLPGLIILLYSLISFSKKRVMKKIILISFTGLLFFCQNLMAQNVGIGTNTPTHKLHVFNGSAGVTAWYNSSLVVESSTDNYISILAPDASETSVLFGKPEGNTSGAIVYNNSGLVDGFQFRTGGNVNRMVLTSTGNLGVGTLSPGLYKTKVTHTTFGLDIENANTADDWEMVTYSTLQLYFNDIFRGSFNNTTGAYTAVSDERLKTNIKPMTAMLDKINLLKPATYQFKNTTDKQEYNGFIAQDVMQIFPSMVTHNVIKERNVDAYTMDYSGFGVLAIKGLQELQTIVTEQKQKIETLEARLNKLETALATITSK
jgi:Chaperone of endosialidase